MNPLFAKAFQKRTQLLREGAGLSQGDMADRLRITADTYKKYESRPNSMLPHEHVGPFLAAVGGDAETLVYLFTGARQLKVDASVISPMTAPSQQK